MPDIENIHANFFEKVFAEVANTATFLKVALPAALRNRLDLTQLTLDPTSYISPAYKRAFSDLVVKCRTKAEKLPVDIYLLFEHKSYQDQGVLLQLLRYMDLMWQQDSVDKKPLRVIIPLVFYHGAGAWRIPTQFIEQFATDNELKSFLLNFTYVLFDANAWNWQDESSRPLKENVYLLSAMLLMKAAFNKDLELIRQVFQLWHQMGFLHEKDRINFLLIYVMETQDVPAAQLETMLEETKLKGEIAMPSTAQQLRNEGMQQALVMQLATRFQLNENEKQFISKISEVEQLTAALKLVVTAQTKEEILESLKAVVH